MFRKLLVAIRRPFSCVAAALLQQRVQRHREQPAEEPDQRQVDRRQRERVRRARESRMANTPMPIDADRREAELDLVAGQPAGRHAADRRCRSPRTSSGSPTQRSLSPITSRAEEDHRRAAAARRGTRSTRCRPPSATARGRGAGVSRPSQISPHGLRVDRAARAPPAGTCGMRKLSAVPTTAMATTSDADRSTAGRATRRT